MKRLIVMVLAVAALFVATEAQALLVWDWDFDQSTIDLPNDPPLPYIELTATMYNDPTSLSSIFFGNGPGLNINVSLLPLGYDFVPGPGPNLTSWFDQFDSFDPLDPGYDPLDPGESFQFTVGRLFPKPGLSDPIWTVDQFDIIASMTLPLECGSTTQTADLTFRIGQSVVPEPSGMILLGMGIAAMIVQKIRFGRLI